MSANRKIINKTENHAKIKLIQEHLFCVVLAFNN